MPFCPNCSTEFIDGTATCSDCDAPLVAERPIKAELVEVSHEATKFVTLRTYSTRMHAEMVVQSLANEGITALIKSNEAFGMGTGLGVMAPARIEVWVPEDRLDDAATIADGTIDPV